MVELLQKEDAASRCDRGTRCGTECGTECGTRFECECECDRGTRFECECEREYEVCNCKGCSTTDENN